MWGFFPPKETQLYILTFLGMEKAFLSIKPMKEAKGRSVESYPETLELFNIKQ